MASRSGPSAPHTGADVRVEPVPVTPGASSGDRHLPRRHPTPTTNQANAVAGICVSAGLCRVSGRDVPLAGRDRVAKRRCTCCPPAPAWLGALQATRTYPSHGSPGYRSLARADPHWPGGPSHLPWPPRGEHDGGFGQSRFRSTTGYGHHPRRPLRNRDWRAAPATRYRNHAGRLLRSPATAPDSNPQHHARQPPTECKPSQTRPGADPHRPGHRNQLWHFHRQLPQWHRRAADRDAVAARAGPSHHADARLPWPGTPATISVGRAAIPGELVPGPNRTMPITGPTPRGGEGGCPTVPDLKCAALIQRAVGAVAQAAHRVRERGGQEWPR